MLNVENHDYSYRPIVLVFFENETDVPNQGPDQVFLQGSDNPFGIGIPPLGFDQLVKICLMPRSAQACI